MKKTLLAIDCSNRLASVAVYYNDKVIFKQSEQTKQHAKILLPLIEELLLDADLNLNQIDAIACCCGPGSFTGVRLTISIAQGLAYSLKLPVIPVSSLQAIAHRCYSSNQQSDIIACIDARMNEVYWAHYRNVGQLCQLQSVEVVGASDEVIKYLELLPSDSVVIAGTGLSHHPELLDAGYQVIETDVLASSIATLATGIKQVNPVDAMPVYIRNQVVQKNKRE